MARWSPVPFANRINNKWNKYKFVFLKIRSRKKNSRFLSVNSCCYLFCWVSNGLRGFVDKKVTQHTCREPDDGRLISGSVPFCNSKIWLAVSMILGGRAETQQSKTGNVGWRNENSPSIRFGTWEEEKQKENKTRASAALPFWASSLPAPHYPYH